MLKQYLKCAALAVLPAACLLADFSYEQTSQMTGGAMMSMMKIAGVFSKQAREPIRATVAVKGDRMVHWSPTRASVIDLGNETITEIDLQKKTYSVMTFAEMKQMLDQLSKKTQKEPGGPDVNFKVSVKDTGQSKQIAGFNAKEMVLQMEMETADPKSGQKGSMVITSDMWIAPKAAGYEEVATFYKRMSEKLAWTPGGMPMMGRSDMSQGMAELAKESAKLDGMPVYQVVKMGAAGMPQGQGQPGQPGATAPPPQQQQQNVEKPSVGGALGGALGGRLGGLGRKKKPQQEDTPPPPPQGDASGSLMEMTTELSNFSSGPVDPSKFEVPAGFKQVKTENRMR